MNYSVIFAGGVGTRMGASLPKQFLEINGTPILAHTIAKFNDDKLIDCIVIVTLKEYLNQVQSIVDKYCFNKVVKVVEGGSTAFESQFNGINVVKQLSTDEKDIILIHDGVRPFINSELIDKCIKTVKELGNAIVVNPASETVAVVDRSGKINHTIPRQDCLIARAPQAFYLKDIYEAHLRAKQENKEYIDSASMMLDQGVSLNPIEGPNENIKITTMYDYQIAQFLIGKKDEKN